MIKLLTECHLKNLSLKGGCRGSSESTLVKTPHCWKSHVTAQIMTVVVEGEHSESAPVESGVPQGTVLGPLIFLYVIEPRHEIPNDLAFWRV